MEHITLSLNARLQPFHRGDRYEDPLDEALGEAGLGKVDGGGTLISKEGEPEECDVEIELSRDFAVCKNEFMQILQKFPIPKGSHLIFSPDNRREIGTLEGLALYLNGIDLPDSIYEKCDINYVVSELGNLLENKGELYSWWEGPQDTALYFYGENFAGMRHFIAPFLDEYPLCQKCRVTQIA
ncbi:MAG: hypothetical protein LBJ12_09320 [Oscillospiraceae bacterium]|jgi:hypothetical protein|nr:hypothetical protein [Oscillospiraceae bacterium]